MIRLNPKGPPSWIQKGRFLSPAPTSVGAPLVGALVLAPNLDRTSKRPIVDRKVFFASLSDPSRIRKVFSVALRGPSWIRKVFSVALRGPSWIQKGRFLSPAPTSVGAPLVGALVLAPNLDRTSKRPIVDRKVFFASLSDPSRMKRCSPWPLAALRGQKGFEPANLSSFKRELAL